MKKLNIFILQSRLVTLLFTVFWILVQPAFAAIEQQEIKDLEFKEALVLNAFRVISETTDTNIIVTTKAGIQKVTVFLRDTDVSTAIDSICRATGLWYRLNEETGVYLIMTAEEYRNDIVVFREDYSEVFTLKFQNVTATGRIIQDLYEDRVEFSETIDEDPFELFDIESLSDGSSSSNRSNSGLNRRENRRRDRNGSFNNNNSSRRGGRGLNNRTEDFFGKKDLSPNQLSNLDSLRDNSQVSQQDLSGVVQQKQARIFLSANHLHNQILVRTSDRKALDDIGNLIRELDKPVPQVLLEMKILDVTIGDQFRSVMDLSHTSGNALGPKSNQPRNPLLPSLIQGAAGGPKTSLGLGNFPLDGGSTALFQLMSNNILARLQLLENDNRVKVLATPMLLASNNTPARLFIGEERVLTTGFDSDVLATDGGGGVITLTTETTTRDIGNTLVIVPSVNSDRTVTLRIQQDTSNVIPGGTLIPVSGDGGTFEEVAIDTVNTANVQATVIAKNNLTVAIGGMIRTTSSDREERVPLLSAIPVLGHLFRSDIRDHARTELVLLITPHIFFTPEEAQQKTQEIIDGQVKKSKALSTYVHTGKTEADRPDLERPRLGGWADTDEMKRHRNKSQPIDLTVPNNKLQSKSDFQLGERIIKKNDVPIGDHRTSDSFHAKNIYPKDESTKQKTAPSKKEPNNSTYSFIELTRFAVSAVSNPGITPPEGIEPDLRLQYGKASKLFSNDSVYTEVVGSWKGHGYHVTAIMLRNRGLSDVAVDEGQFRGDWRAITMDTETLMAEGESGDSGLAYLISFGSFNEAIRGN